MNTPPLPDLQLQLRAFLQVSAASGLVVRDNRAWVVSDDRHSLQAHALPSAEHLHSIMLSPEVADVALRKRDKPDFEALVGLEEGSILALGSGSRPNREGGVRIDSAGRVHALDLSALYAGLREHIPDLNIEGAAVCHGALLLAHRGLGARRSCLARIDLQTCLASPAGRWPASALQEVVPIELGGLDGVPLAFTDLAFDTQGALHYLAAAEHTDDPYLDGGCAGTVIGRLTTQWRAQHLARLRPDVKAEGLAEWIDGQGKGRWLIVTDADDPAQRSQLYEFTLEANP